MKCPNCGEEFTNNETFCTNCGTRLDGLNRTPTGISKDETETITPQPINSDSAKTNGLAIGAFVLSIVSFLFATIILAPISAILSASALNQIKKTNEKGKGLAIAGIVISIVGIIFIIIGASMGIYNK